MHNSTDPLDELGEMPDESFFEKLFGEKERERRTGVINCNIDSGSSRTALNVRLDKHKKVTKASRKKKRKQQKNSRRKARA